MGGAIDLTPNTASPRLATTSPCKMLSPERILYPLLHFKGHIVAATAQQDGDILLDDIVEQIVEQGGQKPISRKNPQNRLLFFIGSATKIFTGFVMYLLLKDRKDVTVDSTVSQVGLDIKGANHITIGQLLTHTSCLPWENYLFLGPAGRCLLDKDATMSFLMSSFKLGDENHGPGTEAAVNEFRYNNIGYILLGLIIERMTNKTYGDVVKELILTPQEMSQTYVCRSDYDKCHLDGASLAPPHVEINEEKFCKVDEMPYFEDTAFLPAFGICSCLEDMKIFFSYLLNKQREEEGYFQFSQQFHECGYGAGVSYQLGGSVDRMSKHADTMAKLGRETSPENSDSTGTEGLKPLEHSGFVRGYECLYEIRPAENYFFICFSNASALDDVVHNVRKLLECRADPSFNMNRFLVKYHDQRTDRLKLVKSRIGQFQAFLKQPRQPERFTDLVGTYKVGDNGPQIRIIKREGQYLVVLHTWDKEIELKARFHENALTFCPETPDDLLLLLGDDFLHEGATKLTIEREGSGDQITGLSLQRHGEENESRSALVFAKVPEVEPV